MKNINLVTKIKLQVITHDGFFESKRT